MMAKFLEGRRILVVDDDYLIAMDIAETVESYGGKVVGPVGRLPEAQELARREQPDGAILDVNLNGNTSYPLARELCAAGVTVVFLTGYEATVMTAEFADLPRLSKPFSPRLGEHVLRNAFGSG